MTHLEQAAQLIEQHMATLNVAKDECPCCQIVRYQDFSQYQQHKELEAVVRKLRRFKPRDAASDL